MSDNVRNHEIWRKYLSGMRQRDIAECFGISQQHVSTILIEMRKSATPVAVADTVARDLAFLDTLRSEVMALWDMPAAPVTAGKDGRVVRDPETGAVVRDHSGRLAAVDRAIKLQERVSKLMGLDAALRLDVSVEAQAEATRAAEAAAERLSGQGE